MSNTSASIRRCCCIVGVIASLIVGAVPRISFAQDQPSPFVVEPQGQEELFDAIALSVRLARPRLAQQYLMKFLATNPNDDAILKLRDKHGPAIFLKFSNIEELQPQGKQLLDRVNAATRRRGVDPDQLNKLITALAGTPAEQRVAVATLRGAGPSVVPVILKKMEDEPANRSVYLASMIRLGRQIVPPLLGALNAPSADIRLGAIEALGYMQDERLLPYLWGPAYDPQASPGTRLTARDALKRIRRSKRIGSSPPVVLSDVEVALALRNIALTHFRNQHEWDTNEDGTVDIWVWSDANQTLEPINTTTADASMFIGQNFARQSLSFYPDDAGVHALFLGFALGREASTVGWSRPMATGAGTAFNLALEAGAESTARVLQDGLKSENDFAVRGALEVLAQVGNRNQLQGPASARSPLVQALDYPDARIRMLATTTILQLDPVTDFSGSYQVVRELKRALSDTGISRAVVADRSADRARAMTARLAETGFEAVAVRSGREAFQVAAERGDVTLIMIEMNISQWALTQTLSNLRADSRTRRIPIIVFGDPDRADIINRLLRQYPLATFIEYATTGDFFRSQVEPFLKATAAAMPSAEERNQQTIAAVYWLSQIATSKSASIFDISSAQAALSEALNDDGLAANALVAMSSIPTGAAQTRLADLVANPNTPEELRIRGAQQLAFHMQRFGLKLPSDRIKIMKQTAQSVQQSGPPEFSTAMSSVLGSMQPSSTQVVDRLRAFKLPPTPIPKQ